MCRNGRPLLRDLDRLQHVRIRHRDHDWLVRTDASKPIADLFCHAHIALPPSAIRIGRVALRSNCISACNFDPPSYGDAAIIAAARALGCREVLSEKMSHGREVERITIGSPFR
ncbi:MAG: hypothetical protein WB820_23515 [Rhodoplanes sp.]